jgi:glutamate-5-semialdehyde dehydrogenase
VSSPNSAPIPADPSLPTVAQIAARARAASRSLAQLTLLARNEILMALAKAIEDGWRRILDANEIDCHAAAPDLVAEKMSAAMFARLKIDGRGIEEMAARVRDVARLPDPLGCTLSATELDDGLTLYKESCPLGVVGIIFESRPEVIPQVGSLALKSGNAVILKGGSEAARTNQVLVAICQECLHAFPSASPDAIQLLHTRADVMELLSLHRDVDLIIPRGSRELVEFVARHSQIPVLGHGEGICHVYVHSAADLRKAVDVTFDSKVQYPAVCNAAETLLVDAAIAPEFLPVIGAKLKGAGVELRGCDKTLALLGAADVKAATEADWATEYGDLILSIKVVDSISDAIAHIHRFGSSHTEAIVTEDSEAALRFMNEVDAAGVFQNASTRFADGYRYGLGAELGVSTNKIHARGPVGLDGLTSYKYKLFGKGHTVAEYARGEKQFKHRFIDP